uniref:Uncharacterized protein n=1 Tax=viral metagenome TaxID=1070528 RepID=A0A6C0C859_9ZZZZ
MYHYDVFSKVCEHLNNKEKIYLTMTCVAMDKFKYKLIYTDVVSYRCVHHLPYYDNFEAIIVDYFEIAFPKNVKKILSLDHKWRSLDLAGSLIFTADNEKKVVKIPPRVTKLKLCQTLIRSIELSIPKSVAQIDFCWGCNDPLEKYITSSSVTHLTLPVNFNHDITDRIPNSVTHLIFGYYFNKPIKKCLPNSITHLFFGHCFDQPIKKYLPNSVTHLFFGHDFDQSIENSIPNSVTYLKFSSFFNQSIKGCIPSSVTHLNFGPSFNRSIKNSIPNSVTHLMLSYHFDKFKEPLPATITHLKIINCEKLDTQTTSDNFESLNDPYFMRIKKFIPSSIIVILIPASLMSNVD